MPLLKPEERETKHAELATRLHSTRNDCRAARKQKRHETTQRKAKEKAARDGVEQGDPPQMESDSGPDIGDDPYAAMMSQILDNPQPPRRSGRVRKRKRQLDHDSDWDGDSEG